MSKKNFYAMTDSAIAEELGRRLEQIRLEANKPQKEIAYELGISEGTYRKAIKGKARLEVIIGIMRILEQLENLENFLPDRPFSPIEMLKLQGKKRQRAASKRSGNTRTSKERYELVTHNVARVEIWGQTVGALSYDKDTGLCAFQYDPSWIRTAIELSPVKLPLSERIYQFPTLSRETYRGTPWAHLPIHSRMISVMRWWMRGSPERVATRILFPGWNACFIRAEGAWERLSISRP